MKSYKHFVYLSSLMLLFYSCNQEQQEGVVITEKFLKNFSGNYIETESEEKVSINPDKKLSIVRQRQVGIDGTDIPYPTVCKYREDGQIKNVINRNTENKKQYMGYAGYIMYYTALKVVLIDDPTNGPECAKFIKSDMAVGESDIYFEILDTNTLRLHTSGGGDYKNDSVRPESTLDEVFERE